MSADASHIKTSHTGLIMPSLVWLAALGAALFGAYLRGVDLLPLAPIAGVAAFPALWSLLLSPVLRREWAQLLVIFGWLALAIIASISIAFIPMAILFLCAPAAAALFEKEKVVEAMVMAAIFAALLFYAGQLGHIPEAQISDSQKLWGQQAGLIATIGLMITTMFSAARSRPAVSGPEPSSVEAETLFEVVNGGILCLDKNDNLMSANSSARKMFGFAQGLSKKRLSALLAKDEASQARLTELVHNVRKTKTSQELLLKTPLENEGLTALNIHGAMLDDYVVLNVIDVSAYDTQITTLQNSFTTAEQKAGDSALFFAGVSHELRTPLNAIIGFSDMMRSRLFGPLPGKYAEYADLIHDSGQHMLDLIGDVLDMSKIDAGKYDLHYESFEAAAVARSSVKMIQPMADAAKVRLDVNIDDEDDLLIEADRKALRQILLNLLSNAIKFSPQGGAVTLSLSSMDGALTLSVADQGIGMSAAELADLGKPYQQMQGGQESEARGTGLGITLVKSLIDLHGGKWDIDSEPGHGTTVKFSFPLMRPAR